MENIINTLAQKLQITREAAEKLVRQEEARKLASKKYRLSEAYKLRLQQQKAVRQMIREVEQNA